MDKDHEYPNKKNTKKNSNFKITRQNNHHNENIKTLIKTIKNELTTKDNDYVQNSSDTYKAFDISLLNKMHSLENNLENNQLSSNLMKKQSKLNSANKLKNKKIISINSQF